MALLNEFGNTLKEILIISLSILFILFGYPILFIILIVSWIYKQWAIKEAQKDPKTQKGLENLDGALAGLDPYSDPVMVLLPYFFLANKLDKATVVKVLNEKVISLNIYPELTQRIVQKFGYHFWYSVDNFKVENHVRYLKPECPNLPITRTELTYILTKTFTDLPFDSTKSPWEILVIPNMVDDRDPEVKSAFVLRVNHCLMDGYAVAYFLKKVGLFKSWKFRSGEILEEPKKGKHKYVEIYKMLMLLFFGPYHFLKMFVFSNDRNQFVKNALRPDSETVFNDQCTPAISDTRLKSVKHAYGVTMSSLIITLFGQATRECMIRAGIPVSNIIHGLLAYPLPGHGDRLTNHCTLVRIPIKIKEADPTKALQLVETEFQSFRDSVKPLVIIYLSKIIQLFPLWLRPNSKSILPPSTFLLSNFPGPAEPCDFFGCMATHFGLGGRPSPGIPLVHKSLSLAGNFWLQVGGPVCNLPNQRDVDAVCESIMDTLSELEMKMK